MFHTFSVASTVFGKQIAFEKLSKHFTWVIIAFGLKMDVGDHPHPQEHFTEGIIQAWKTSLIK